MAVRVLLDTDIGSDIDDAVCLAYLLAQPECELVGITTVTGQADKRAMMASALCKAAGRDVIVFPGCERPLLVDQRQPHAPQAAALSNWEHTGGLPHGEAIELMRRTIRGYPGEVVLLTIGPLTNVGLLFALDPEIPSLLKALVMMCGAFGSPIVGSLPVEWNAGGDPHATALVYRGRAPVHRSIGLDVTLQVTMARNEVERRFRHPLLAPVLDFAQVWFKDQEKITFHDPLAAATIFEEEICRFEKGNVEVELADEKCLGMTRWEPDGPEAHHEVAMSVDTDRFFEHYFSVFD